MSNETDYPIPQYHEGDAVPSGPDGMVAPFGPVISTRSVHDGFPDDAFAVERKRTPWYRWVVGGCLAVTMVLIIGCASVMGVFGGLAWHYANLPEVRSTVSKTFIVQAAPTLKLVNGSGDVTVRSGDGSHVVVTAIKRAQAETSSDAQSSVRNIPVTMEQSGNTVMVTANGVGESDLGHIELVDLTVIVPRISQLAITVDSGNVSVQNVAGSFAIQVNAGGVTLSGVEFRTTSSVRVAAGNISVSGVVDTGSAVNVRVNTGDVTLRVPADSTMQVDAYTDSGDIATTGLPLMISHAGPSATATSVDGVAGCGYMKIRVDTGKIGFES